MIMLKFFKKVDLSKLLILESVERCGKI